MTLYLQSILSTKSSGIITLDIPVIDGAEQNRKSISGFLTEDIQFSVKNEWGNIIPNLETLSGLSQIIGSQDILTWVAATQAGWKGTAPIELSTEFYMYSIDPSSKIKESAKALLKLASLYATGEATVEVHGGYSPYYMQNNLGDIPSGADAISNWKNNIINNTRSDTSRGTVTLTVGNQLTFTDLLLVQANTVHSNVEVARGEPLYIKVNATFRGRKALMASDIDTIYG